MPNVSSARSLPQPLGNTEQDNSGQAMSSTVPPTEGHVPKMPSKEVCSSSGGEVRQEPSAASERMSVRWQKYSEKISMEGPEQSEVYQRWLALRKNSTRISLAKGQLTHAASSVERDASLAPDASYEVTDKDSQKASGPNSEIRSHDIPEFFERWQELGRTSVRSNLSQGQRSQLSRIASVGHFSESEDATNGVGIAANHDIIDVSPFEVLQNDLHLLDEKMDIVLEVMFKNLKYSKAIYISGKKSVHGPGHGHHGNHGAGAVARLRMDAPDPAPIHRSSAKLAYKDSLGKLARNDLQPASKEAEDSEQDNRRTAIRKKLSGDRGISNMRDLSRVITKTQMHPSKWKQIRAFIWRSMEDRTSSKTAAAYFIGINCFLCFSIAFAISDVIKDSGSGSDCERQGLAMVLALTIEIYFALEIGLRFWVCPTPRLFWFNPFNIIDAVSAIPIVLRFIFFILEPPCDVVYVIMCLVPALRLMKLLRRFETFHLLASAFRASAEALPSILFTLMLITLFFGAIIAYCEPRSNIPDYPMAIWYVIITLVGLAPSFPAPVTTEGKAVTVVLMLCGTLYMAIPIGIVGAAFSQVWDDRQRLLVLQRMRACVERAGYSPKDLQTMFSLLDEDEDGMLDFAEFTSMLEVMQIEVQERFAIEVFESFDSDCEGSIDFRELVRGLFPRAHWLVSEDSPSPTRTMSLGSKESARDSAGGN